MYAGYLSPQGKSQAIMESTEEPQIDPLDRKAYIRGWERKAPPEEKEINYWFCEFAKDAAIWETALQAEQARSILNIGVATPSHQGGIRSPRNFSVEAFANKFVISGSGPFIYTGRGSSNQNVGE
jgi:hypothetical protein